MWYEGTKFLWNQESLWKRVHRVKNIGIDDLETDQEGSICQQDLSAD